jgi:hypothetical protein
MNVRPPDVIVCLLVAAVAFALGAFSMCGYRVTFDGPSEEPAPAPSPYAFEGEGWKIQRIKTGPSLPNIHVVIAPDGTRWATYGNTNVLTPWPVKTP